MIQVVSPPCRFLSRGRNDRVDTLGRQSVRPSDSARVWCPLLPPGRATAMATRRTILILGCLLLALAMAFGIPHAAAQGPTIPTGPAAPPGSTASRLGPTPGAGGSPFGFMPGAGEMILGGGRPGPSFPRVPSSIAMPGQGTPVAARPSGIAAPGRLPIANLAIYGTLALPRGTEDEGPPEGLTLDQAIERLVRDNLDLHSKSFEIPQAHADVLT